MHQVPVTAQVNNTPLRIAIKIKATIVFLIRQHLMIVTKKPNFNKYP